MNQRIFSNKEIFIFFIILILELTMIIEIEYYFSYKQKKIIIENVFEQNILLKNKEIIIEIKEEKQNIKIEKIFIDIPQNKMLELDFFEIDDDKKEEYELFPK